MNQPNENNLKVYLGDTPAGEKVYLDFNEVSHLIIVGSPAAGKSVTIHRMINDLSSQSTPEQVGFVLFDPKKVELCVWRDLPNLIMPIATDREEGRERIEKVNAIMQDRLSGLTSKEQHIFVIIDELADFVVGENSGKIDNVLSSILEVGSAANIHLLAASQAPTGLFKSKKLSFSAFPYRLIGRFYSKVDSRRFLGNSDATELHSGDMFLLTPTEKTRLHIPFFVKDA